jgi:predicted nucleic acid-binding protein
MIAAHAIEHVGVVHTDDRDFSRFAEVRVHNPLA